MSPRVVDTAATIRPRSGVDAATKVAAEADGMVPNVVIAVGLIDRRGSASAALNTTSRMTTTFAEDDPDQLAIDRAATSGSTPTDLNHLDVLPPRQIQTGNTMVTVMMDANPALETSMLKYMPVQHGKRLVS